MGVLWLRFLKEIRDQSEEIPEEFTQEKEINEALTYLMESSFSTNELEFYDKYWDIISSEKTMRSDSIKKGIEQGIKIGKEEQKIKGIQKTILRGKLTLEEIAEDFEASLAFVQKIKSEM